jgi:hypothetical protein
MPVKPRELRSVLRRAILSLSDPHPGLNLSPPRRLACLNTSDTDRAVINCGRTVAWPTLFPRHTEIALFVLPPGSNPPGGSAMAPPLIGGGLASRVDIGLRSESGRGLRVGESLPGSVAGGLTSLVAASFVFHFLSGSSWMIVRLQRLWLRQDTVQRYRQVSQWRDLSYIDWRESLPCV